MFFNSSIQHLSTFQIFLILTQIFIDLKQVHSLELCYLQYSSQQMSFYNNLRLISLLTLATCILAQNFSQFAQRKVTSTIVTGWWPSGDSSTTPKGEVEASFTKLLSLPLNIVIFGPASLQEFINQKKSKANTKFVSLQAEDIEKTWFKKIVNDLKKSGKNPSVKDKVCQTLSYARMWLLNSALTHDSFGSQELIWADINAINQPHIASVLDDKNLNTLLLAFKHHFFMVTSPKNEAHSYPNIQKTYFEAKYDIFTSSALFGGKRQAITTVYRLFDDQMKVAIEYDRNLWSEDALFSLLADRSPYLVSYFTPQAPSGPQKRILIETTIQDEKRQLESYQTKIKYCEYAILLIAILIAFQIIRFVNSVKRLNKVLENRSTVESQQMSKVNQSRD